MGSVVWHFDFDLKGSGKCLKWLSMEDISSDVCFRMFFLHNAGTIPRLDETKAKRLVQQVGQEGKKQPVGAQC